MAFVVMYSDSPLMALPCNDLRNLVIVKKTVWILRGGLMFWGEMAVVMDDVHSVFSGFWWLINGVRYL
ncbi:MAG: hypothetical protein WCI03_15055 [bacterium]